MLKSKMVANSRLPLITKASRNLFITAKEHPDNLKNLRYIPDWFIKREHCGNYNDFNKKMQTFYPDFSIKKLAKFVKKEGQKIGEGRHAETYSIPQIDDYVIRISRNKSLGFFSRVKKLQKTSDNYYGFNFGQPIASNNDGISIHVKAIGEEYGIKSWYTSLKRNKAPTKRQANRFVEQDLARLSEFPQSSYDDFIKRVSFVTNATPYTFDFVNPNNFIIDYKNKKINIVDTSLKDIDNFWYSNLDRIPSTLCDTGTLFYTASEVFEKSTQYTNEIMKKCGLALSKYRDSYPRLGWEGNINTNKESTSQIQNLFQLIKKILENISLRSRAKHFGEKIENLNKLD